MDIFTESIGYGGYLIQVPGGEVQMVPIQCSSFFFPFFVRVGNQTDRIFSRLDHAT